MGKWKLLALMLLLVLVACARETPKVATPTLPPTSAPEPVAVADTAEPRSFTTDFRPQPDGFRFQNYRAQFPEGDLTVVEARELFGDQVCARIEDDTCFPTAETQTWIDQMNGYMHQTARCVGFTVMSYRLHQGQYAPADFAPGATQTFDVDQNPTIMRKIARDWTRQLTDAVREAEVRGTPRQVLEALRAQEGIVELGITNRSGEAHSLLAYGVEDKGQGIVWIWVYDNNWPGQELYAIVDTNADTWRYSLAAMNPGDDVSAWEGNAATESLFFIPLSAYDDETPTCPWCPVKDESDYDKGFVLASLLGRGEALVKTAGGEIGRWGGKVVNTIAGSEIISIRSALSSQVPPLLLVPTTEDVTFQFQADPAPHAGSLPARPADLAVMAPNLSARLTTLSLQANQPGEIFFSPSDGQVRYMANGEEPSALELVVSQEETSYLFVLGTVDLEVGQALKISMAPGTDQLTLNGQGLVAETVSLVAVRLDTAGEAIFATSDLPLTIGDVLALDLATWDGEGAMDLLVDEEGDGTFDSPIPLENEPLGALIEGAEAAAPIIAMLDNVAPYLSEPQIGALLHSLSASDLSGDDVGELLFALAELELTDSELIALLTDLDLPLEELAEFLVALRLDTDHLDDLIAALGLSPQIEEELRVRLAELAEVKAALAEWEFLNVGDLETLIGFLDQKGLSRYQLEYLMKKLNLPDSLREMILAALGFLVEQPAPAPTPTPTPTPAPTLTTNVLATSTSPPAPSSTPTQIPSQVSTLPETGGPTPNWLSGLLIFGGAALLALGCTGIWKSRRNH